MKNAFENAIKKTHVCFRAGGEQSWGGRTEQKVSDFLYYFSPVIVKCVLTTQGIPSTEWVLKHTAQHRGRIPAWGLGEPFFVVLWLIPHSLISLVLIILISTKVKQFHLSAISCKNYMRKKNIAILWSESVSHSVMSDSLWHHGL